MDTRSDYEHTMTAMNTAPGSERVSVITPLNFIHATLPSYLHDEKEVAVKQENGSDDGYGSILCDAHSSSTSNQPTGAGVDKSSPSFNPATHHFSPDELKPTPIQRKSRKTLVRVEDKDDKYWDKRRKNNMAAKRSREARRSRENQISLRASYLEKDNATLKEELLNVKEELQSLRETLLIAQQQNERMSHQQQQQQRHMKQPMRSHQQSNGVMLNNN